jgi:hypothetical protein
MQKRARADINSNISTWHQEKARNTLENFDSKYQAALPGWVNRLVSNKEKKSRGKSRGRPT